MGGNPIPRSALCRTVKMAMNSA